jgi:hypothetical protein
MCQKNNDTLGQTHQSQVQFNVNYHRGSTIEFWRSRGIPSKNTTLEKIGQTKLIYLDRTKPVVDDDSLEASIRNLKLKRFMTKF